MIKFLFRLAVIWGIALYTYQWYNQTVKWQGPVEEKYVYHVGP